MHKKKAGKLQTGSTFPKQYWLAVNGKPKIKFFNLVYKIKQAKTEKSGVVDRLKKAYISMKKVFKTST